MKTDALRRRSSAMTDETSMKTCAKVLSLCPEVLTAWNHRREAIERGEETRRADADEDEASTSARDAWWREELALSENALKSNPKSYPSWYHRKWVIERMIREMGRDDARARETLAREEALCATSLNADDRNFHCWSYRAFIARALGRTSEEELAYTMTKIENNFSNYSAWHYRSAILEAAGEARRAETLAREFELVSNAFYTEPEDQSAWMYHRWLVSRARALECASERETLLESALETCREVSELEPECKWPLLARVALGDEKSDKLYDRLMTIDPARSGYYRDVIARGVL